MFRIVGDAGDFGVECWQVRDRIYPAGSKMRTHRPRHHGASSGEAGTLGNMMVGRILAALAGKQLVRKISRDPNRYVLTAKGRELIGSTTPGSLF